MIKMAKQKLELPDLPDFYRVQPKDFERTIQMYGKAFEEDPIWRVILQDEPEKFPLIFGVPVKYALRYGKVYATSPKIEAAATWLPYPYTNVSLWRYILSGCMPSAFKLGRKIGKTIYRVFNQIEKDKEERMTMPYAYLYVLGVHPDHQGEGHGTILVKKMIEALPPNIPL